MGLGGQHLPVLEQSVSVLYSNSQLQFVLSACILSFYLNNKLVYEQSACIMSFYLNNKLVFVLSACIVLSLICLVPARCVFEHNSI